VIKRKHVPHSSSGGHSHFSMTVLETNSWIHVTNQLHRTNLYGLTYLFAIPILIRGVLPPHSAARLHSMFMDASCNCMRAPRANEGPGAYASACASARRSQDVFLSHVAHPLGPFGPTGYVFYSVLFSPSDGISVISGDS
jgi:hypothetical protein